MALQSFQQLTGANYFFYYGATIFTSVGLADSFVTQIILGAVNFVCTFGGLYIMQRVSPSICFFYLLTYAFSFLQYGRRIPLMLGGVWQSAWLFVFAAAGTAKVPQNNPGIGKCTDVFMLAFQLSSLKMYSNDRQCMLLHLWLRHDLGSVSLSVIRAKPLYIISIVVYGSLSERRFLRGREQSRERWQRLPTGRLWNRRDNIYQHLRVCSYRLWNFLLAFFTPFIVSSIQFKYGFVFAGDIPSQRSIQTARHTDFCSYISACNLTGAVFVYFFYESADLSLESVDRVCCTVTLVTSDLVPLTPFRCTTTQTVNHGHLVHGRQRDTPRAMTSSTKQKLRR